jgi:hypothetical protein
VTDDQSAEQDADAQAVPGVGREPREDSTGAPDVPGSGGPDRDRLVPTDESDRLVLTLVVLALIVLGLIVLFTHLDMNQGGGSGVDPNTVYK